MGQDPPSLDAGLTSFSSLGLKVGRTTGAVVGRRAQLEAVERELTAARQGLVCVALEGEPGIGKTRLLLAVEELARLDGFVPVAVTAEEEIRGPFLVARSLFAASAMLEAAERTGTESRLRRVLDVLFNQDDRGLESLTSDRKLLRIFDLAAVAARAIAIRQPLALLIDDLQWADEDSLRLLRYLIRLNMENPIALLVAGRREEMAAVPAAVGLLADLERMGVLRRFGLTRFTQPESTELLQQILGGPVQLASAVVMHAQAEGVPFVLTEQVRAYREAGLIQPIDGVWTLARNAERLLPSAVRTLIQRREARLPENTKLRLSEAAVLGRHFSLRDLREMRRRLGEEVTEAQLADALAPAVAAGLLSEHPDDAAADYGFTHEQLRDFAVARLNPPQRRAFHAAVVEMLTSGGEPARASLPLIARHAVAAGEIELGARMSIEAARTALAAHAPEEALRLIDLAHAIASEPKPRVALLQLRDDALEMLHRPKQRLEGLAELAALADALGDLGLELEVMLRRAAALRRIGDWESAEELARRVRELAARRGDAWAELTACLELGQALLRADLGVAYSQSANDVDLGAAEEAFRAAVDVARKLGDEARQAAAVREIGIIYTSQLRHWMIERLKEGEYAQFQARVAAGETVQELLDSLPVGPLARQANEHLREALEIYERIGDRPGAMSTILAMAVVNWAPEIHLAGSARRIEEIHRLMARLQSFTNESQRALAEVQMLFGSHVYARAKVFPDVALTKGEEAYAAARAIGDRSVEFAVAGGLVLAHLELDDVAAASLWLDRATDLASEAPSPLRARQIELWRGMCAAVAGDAAGMRSHLEKAARLAADHGRLADRCEILAQLALESARLAAETGNQELFELAERISGDVRTLLPTLPGRPPWGAQASAALARLELARGNTAAAAAHGRTALQELDATVRDDPALEAVLPASAALLAGGSAGEVEAVRARLRMLLGLITQRISDAAVRVRWFRAPLGRELARLAGRIEASPDRSSSALDQLRLGDAESQLLQLLAEGRTNAEIASALDLSESLVDRRLAELYVRIGASSRADATASAFIRRMV
jgi:DNA-binding NarL/FixJ family response regulator/tetratricopeptide (TPR) repeat protein